MWYLVKPLLRRPLLPLLIVLQVSVACAIATNALFLLQQKLAPVLAPVGIGDAAHLVYVHQMFPVGKPWSAARMRAVELRLRAVPGVAAVSYAASLPMAGEAIFTSKVGGPAPQPEIHVVEYIGDNLVKALGLHLIAGRDFTPQERSVTVGGSAHPHKPGAVIITRSLARRLFPRGAAAGKLLPGSNTPIVGVVAHLLRNQFGRAGNLNAVLLEPGIEARWPAPMFAVRLTTTRTMPVCKAITKLVQHALGPRMLPGHPVQCTPFATLRKQMLAPMRAAVWLLAGVTLVVLIVTLTGVMGLTGYWVQQRTKEIGIRRALGATRGAILRQIQAENLLVGVAGVVLGLIAALAANLWLMRHYELLRLPWPYLPIGAALLLVLGQLAVLKPALHASRVPPVVATRSV